MVRFSLQNNHLSTIYEIKSSEWKQKSGQVDWNQEWKMMKIKLNKWSTIHGLEIIEVFYKKGKPKRTYIASFKRINSTIIKRTQGVL